ncbi:lytic transglycosylase domain-containing protein [Yinghuangia sp. YIM S10712]|uniref:lytic transglycosylase domain-containing protein n=1 Tax=Yinghuangia sp. YIM S10712 TaxID=3436930 RepID=UPI003F535283
MAARPDAAAKEAPAGGDSADEIDEWITSLGSRPPEMAAREEAAVGGTPSESAKRPWRRRIINPWVGAAAVVALLLVAAASVENLFTMVTTKRVDVSDVPKMSDPEPDPEDGPVNGGSPVDLALPPAVPLAAPVETTASPTPGAPLAPPPAAPVTVPSAGTPAVVAMGSNGIPRIVLLAYQMAAVTTAKADPDCRLPWQLLAGIGRVESGHANGGQVDVAGTAVTPILGPRLDGSRNTMAIRDTDQGALDYDREYDRAVGPMQFIPTSWRAYALDGSNDRKADPQNVFDAALTAARYLCAGDRDLGTPAGLDRAIYSYNRSAAYVNSVKAWMVFYQAGVRPIAASLPPVAAPPPAPPAPAPTTAAPPPPPPPATTTPPTSPPATTASPSPTKPTDNVSTPPPSGTKTSPTNTKPTGESSASAG